MVECYFLLATLGANPNRREHTASIGRFNRTLDSIQDLSASSEPAVEFVLY